jgi:hypothetical protein
VPHFAAAENAKTLAGKSLCFINVPASRDNRVTAPPTISLKYMLKND